MYLCIEMIFWVVKIVLVLLCNKICMPENAPVLRYRGFDSGTLLVESGFSLLFFPNSFYPIYEIRPEIEGYTLIMSHLVNKFGNEHNVSMEKKNITPFTQLSSPFIAIYVLLLFRITSY